MWLHYIFFVLEEKVPGVLFWFIDDNISWQIDALITLFESKTRLRPSV